MAIIFYLLGWLGLLAGVGLAFLGLHDAGISISGIQRQFDGTLSSLSFLAPAQLGGWFFLSGLLLLAVGGLLARLGVIATYAKRAALGRNIG